MRAAMNASFGSFTACRAALAKAAEAHFGSGWLWLVQNATVQVAPDAPAVLEALTTHDADVPTSSARRPLLCIDLWEHAYYLDYQHQRAQHVGAVLDGLVDWAAASERLL